LSDNAVLSVRFEARLLGWQDSVYCRVHFLQKIIPQLRLAIIVIIDGLIKFSTS